MAVVTRCARRAVRLLADVRGAREALTDMKRAAHRADRRASRMAIRTGAEPLRVCRVTSWEVA